MLLCLATGAKRCGVCRSVTKCNCSGTQSTVYCMTLYLVSVSAHLSTCTYPVYFKLAPIGSTPLPDCPTWTTFSYLKFSQLFPRNLAKFCDNEKQTSDVTCTVSHRLAVTMWADQDENEEPLEVTCHGDTYLNFGSVSNIVLAADGLYLWVGSYVYKPSSVGAEVTGA